MELNNYLICTALQLYHHIEDNCLMMTVLLSMSIQLSLIQFLCIQHGQSLQTEFLFQKSKWISLEFNKNSTVSCFKLIDDNLPAWEYPSCLQTMSAPE